MRSLCFMQPALLAGNRIGRLAGLFLWGSFSQEGPFSTRRRENGSIPSGRFQASGLLGLWVRSFDSLDDESNVVRKPSGRGAAPLEFCRQCAAYCTSIAGGKAKLCLKSLDGY